MSNYTLLTGDAIAMMRTLPANSVQMVCTSPPYFGLRAYLDNGHPDKALEIGLEETPDAYVAKLVDVFREVRRVLHSSGTVWLNLGSSYVGGGNSRGKDYESIYGSGKQTSNRGTRQLEASPVPPGYKSKDLLLIPAMVAIALQRDGWYLRSEIIWHKRAPMPESVQDRPTKAHEQVFLLSKNATYYYDHIAIMEPVSRIWDENNIGVNNRIRTGVLEGKVLGRETDPHGGLSKTLPNPNGRNRRSVWTIGPEPQSGVVSYGTHRIASPDCPVHDYQADRDYALGCDERQDVFHFDRNLGSDDRRVEWQERDVVSIPLGQYGLLFDETSAIFRNTRSHKTDGQLVRDVTFFGIPPSHTEYIKFLHRCVSKSDHTPANSILADCVSGEPESGEDGQTLYRILGICTFLSPSKMTSCTCHYIGKVEKRQDHFASMPSKLVEPCILAGTSAYGCCAKCGSPWERVVEREKVGQLRPMTDNGGVHTQSNYRSYAENGRISDPTSTLNHVYANATLGWQPTCTCGCADVIPCTVLDPFSGSGTVAAIALKFGRNAIGIDLSAAYNEMAHRRIEQTQPLLLAAG